MFVEDEGSEVNLGRVVGEGNEGLWDLAEVERVRHNSKGIEGALRRHSETQNAIVALVLEIDEVPGIRAIVALVRSQNIEGVAVVGVIDREAKGVDPFPSSVERDGQIT